jgi:L-malate glycosyltransferase
MKKIIALVPNILNVSPGQRVRIETWAKHIGEYGWTVDFYPFESDKLNKILYRPGNIFPKASEMISCYAKQLKRIFDAPECDVLFIYREAALIGPAIIERLAKRLRVPIVYDLDDPIFLPYKSPVNGWLSRLKFSRKTNSIFRLSSQVITINNIIGNYARKYNENVAVVPNFVDTDIFRPIPAQKKSPVKLVWTGSISTFQNLTAIAEPLRRLQAKYGVPIKIITSGEPEIPGVKFDSQKWTADTEVSSLQGSNIGLVPLLDLEWNPWKFYLKTIQYLAVGLPVVARKIGSNSEVIKDGISGFVVETEEEWFDRLALLIESHTLRRQMGEAARQTALENYSIAVQMPRVAEIFNRTLENFNTRRQ